jgi:Cys-rich protein (TIGR01571 family)
MSATEKFRIWLYSIIFEVEKETVIGWLFLFITNLILASVYGVFYKFKIVDLFTYPLYPQGYQATSYFDFGACDLLKHSDMCCMATFCPCVRAAHTLQVTGILAYWLALVCFTMTCVIPGCPVCWGTYYRIKLKQHLGLSYTICGDSMQVLCCFNCSIAQEALHVDHLMGRKVRCCLKLEWNDDDVQWLYGTVDTDPQWTNPQLTNPQWQTQDDGYSPLPSPSRAQE